MIDVSSVVNIVTQRLKKAGPDTGVKLLTYKKDRHVTIIRIDREHLKVVENGFEQQELVIRQKELRRTLKCLLKREFPRSNKVHIKTIHI